MAARSVICDKHPSYCTLTTVIPNAENVKLKPKRDFLPIIESVHVPFLVLHFFVSKIGSKSSDNTEQTSYFLQLVTSKIKTIRDLSFLYALCVFNVFFVL